MGHATTLIVIRHGHTAANGAGDHVPMSGGRTDTVLSPLGKEQAGLVAERLGPALISVPIYSSPLCRAMRTVRGLAAAAGSLVNVRAGLREIDCGGLEGMAISEVKRRHPLEWQQNLRHDDPDFRWPGGESYREFRRRCIAEIRDIAAAHSGGRAVVVTHSGVVSQVVGSLAGAGAERWDLFRPGNASITELLWGADGGTLVRFDDRSHLAPRAVPGGIVTTPATTLLHAG